MPARSERDRRRPSSKAQQRFLAAIETRTLTLDELLADQQVSPAQFARWLTSPLFRRHLARRLRGVRRLTEVRYLLGTRRALEQLLALVSGGADGAPDARRRACVDVLKLPAPVKAVKTVSRRTAAPHPSVPPDRAKALQQLLISDDTGDSVTPETSAPGCTE